MQCKKFEKRRTFFFYFALRYDIRFDQSCFTMSNLQAYPNSEPFGNFICQKFFEPTGTNHVKYQKKCEIECQTLKYIKEPQTKWNVKGKLCWCLEKGVQATTIFGRTTLQSLIIIEYIYACLCLYMHESRLTGPHVPKHVACPVARRYSQIFGNLIFLVFLCFYVIIVIITHMNVKNSHQFRCFFFFFSLLCCWKTSKRKMINRNECAHHHLSSCIVYGSGLENKQVGGACGLDFFFSYYYYDYFLSSTVRSHRSVVTIDRSTL